MLINGSFAIFVCLLGVVAYYADKYDKPSIPAYLIVGLVLGPLWSVLSNFSVIPPISITGDVLSLVSELGLLFLLFIVGLQVQFKQISDKLKTGASMSLIQGVGVALVASIYLYLAGFSDIEILVLSAALVPSSAAIVIPILKRQGELSSESGRLDVSVLVLENIYLVVAIGAMSAIAQGSAAAFVSVLAAIGVGLGLAYAGSKFVLPRLISEVLQDQKSFLMLGFGVLGVFVVLSELAGLRPVVGAFFAGVALAQLPYSNELQAAVDPMTEFFLAIFLASLGLGISPTDISAVAVDAVVLSAIVLPVKILSYFLSSFYSSTGGYASLRSALDLSQVPDVSIVMVSAAASIGFAGGSTVALITLIVIITMAASSILMNSADKLVSKMYSRQSHSREDTDAILLGSRKYDSIVLDILEKSYDNVVQVGRNPKTSASRSDDTVYGDFSHEEVRQKAGVGSAEVLVTLENDLDVEEEIIEEFSSKTLILSEESPEVGLEFLKSSADYIVNPEVMAANELVERVKHE